MKTRVIFPLADSDGCSRPRFLQKVELNYDAVTSQTGLKNYGWNGNSKSIKDFVQEVNLLVEWRDAGSVSRNVEETSKMLLTKSRGKCLSVELHVEAHKNVLLKEEMRGFPRSSCNQRRSPGRYPSDPPI